MLVIWTSAKQENLDKSFGRVLKNFRPSIPPHRFVAWVEGDAVPKIEPDDVLLALGAKTGAAAQAAGIVPKNRTLNSLREKVFQLPGGGRLMFSFDPGILISEPDKIEVIEWDVRLAVRAMRTGNLMPEVGTYRWVNDLSPVIDYVNARYKATGEPVYVAMDTETMGLVPWYKDKDIISISFTAEPHTSHLVYLGPQPAPIQFIGVNLFDQIKWLLNSPKVKLRGANLKFDMLWIVEKWGIECTNFKFDTLLVGSLMNENRSNSLNLHAKIFTDIGGYDDPFNAKYDKAHMELVPTDDLLTYAGGDTDACQQAGDVLYDQLVADGELANFYVKIMHPAARAFEKLERRGVLVDVPQMKELGVELKAHSDKYRDIAMGVLPNKLRIKYSDRIDAQMAASKSPLLPSLLKEFFFSPAYLNLKPKMLTDKTKEPKMSRAHLSMFRHVPEAAAMLDALTEMGGAAKTLSTFVTGFLNCVRPDGRIHPSYMLFHGGYQDDEDDESGSVTGRLSAKDPAFQTIPKKTKWAKKLRKCYPAPPGKVMISIDYSQGELKVVACVAKEKTMLNAYENGLDLHAVTGAKLATVDLAEFLSWKDNPDKVLAERYDLNRSNAKPANFGLLYGMSAEGFLAYAWSNYGLKLTLAEAEVMRNAFFELYPGLLGYHETQREMVKFTEAVRSPLGRIRHLPTIRSIDRSVRSKAERQAINAPIQSTLTDMMCWAIALIERAYPGGEIEVCGMIHDALIAYVPEHEVALWAGRAAEIMSNLPFNEVGWKPQLPFTVDVEAGLNLADLKKLKLAA